MLTVTIGSRSEGSEGIGRGAFPKLPDLQIGFTGAQTALQNGNPGWFITHQLAMLGVVGRFKRGGINLYIGF